MVSVLKYCFVLFQLWIHRSTVAALVNTIKHVESNISRAALITISYYYLLCNLVSKRLHLISSLGICLVSSGHCV